MFGRRLKKIESDDLDSEFPTEEAGVSLEELGRAYAEAINTEEVTSSSIQLADNPVIVDEPQETFLAAPDVADSDGLPVTTEGALEAILFVGGESSQSIPTDRILGLFQGMTMAELDESVERLNKRYRHLGSVFEIVKEKGGYRLKLINHASNLRDRFQGKVREIPLQQSAIDCLAMVAYTPGISRQEIENLWGNSPTSTLNLLIRRGLLRTEKEGAITKYFTTEKFLEIAGIGSLDDLPREEL